MIPTVMNDAVAIPVKVTDPPPVDSTATPVEATPTGFVVNDKIGPFKSKVVCLFNILNSFS
jgi:hypothetical protein